MLECTSMGQMHARLLSTALCWSHWKHDRDIGGMDVNRAFCLDTLGEGSQRLALLSEPHVSAWICTLPATIFGRAPDFAMHRTFRTDSRTHTNSVLHFEPFQPAASPSGHAIDPCPGLLV